ncbi:hypothetical protein ACFE04_031862 [Oxalis oulophora]
MRKSAFEGNILRLLRNEIQYELESSPPKQVVLLIVIGSIQEIVFSNCGYIGEYILMISDHCAVYGIESPPSKYGNFTITDRPGESWIRLTGKYAWPDTLEITKLFIRKQDKMPAQPYVGPEFNEMDDEMQDSLYNFLEERGINDDLAVFLHAYMKNKDKTEFINWMGTVKTYIEKK